MFQSGQLNRAAACPAAHGTRRHGRFREKLDMFLSWRLLGALGACASVLGDDSPTPCPMGPRWSRKSTGVDMNALGLPTMVECSNMGSCQNDGTCKCDNKYYGGDACQTLYCTPGGVTGINDCGNTTCALCTVETNYCPYVDSDYECTRDILGILSIPKPSKCSKKRLRECERDYPPKCTCDCVACGSEADAR